MAQVVVSSKGQVVLPKEIRERLGLDKGVVLDVDLLDEQVVLRPARRGPGGWRKWKGILKGTNALGEHLREHCEEVGRDGQGG